MRCLGWRFCTRDNISVHINGELDEKAQQVALKALGERETGDQQQEDSILPAALTKRLMNVLPDRRGRRQGGAAQERATDSGSYREEAIRPESVVFSEANDLSLPGLEGSLPKEVVPEVYELIEILSNYQQVEDAKKREIIFRLGFFRLNVIFVYLNITKEKICYLKSMKEQLLEMAKELIRFDSVICYLFKALKNERSEDALAIEYHLSQSIIDKIRNIPDLKLFWQDLDKVNVLAACHPQTVLVLWQIAAFDESWLQRKAVRRLLSQYNLLSWVKEV